MANDAKILIKQMLGPEMDMQILSMDDDDAKRLATIMSKPTVQSRVNRTRVPYGATLLTNYGAIVLDSSLTHIDNIYVNGQKFMVKENGLDAIEKATGSESEIKDVLGQPEGRQRRGRKTRSRVKNDNIPFDVVQEQAFDDLSRSGLTYDSLFTDLNGLMSGRNIDLTNISDELFSNRVEESDIPRFLVYDSQYKNDIISQIYGLNLGSVESDYNFKTQLADESFVGKLINRLGETEAQYDEEAGIIKIGDRLITNIPIVDDKGVFHNRDTKYLPYYVGYFEAGEGTRSERLRVSDPVAAALDALALQYSMTDGDIKFKTILDVTRNLPDFDIHPYGEEILDTLKHKVVIDKSYEKTNSLLADYTGKANDLGAIALTMLDDDAEGLIDPLGTSNGGNLGKILYLADGVQINDDGTLVKSDKKYSKVGNILSKYAMDKDNFNRNQMSFNAFLTSTDVKEVNTAYAEFGLFNSEDAVVMTAKGAKTAFADEKFHGDKIMDFHGNKSTISLIVDPNLSDEDAKEQSLTQAVEFARLNPNLDLIVSPLSIASRMNMGVAHEGLVGPKEDLYLPDGSIIKDGIVKMMYMSLPQTAAHKSKNYEVEGNGRRYSTLLRYALASKVGDDMYNKALIDDKVRQEHIDEIDSAFGRLGVSFVDKNKLITEGNVRTVVDADVEVPYTDFKMLTPSVIRSQLMSKMINGGINIDLGDLQVHSPLTQEPIVDSFGTNVLPIRVDKNGSIPYRYMEVFEALSLGNREKLESAYARATAVDFRALTRKDNLLKNINTMNFKRSAHTDVLIPDPRLKLNEIRSTINDDRIIIHRDPAIQSGNVMSVDNIGGGHDNVVQVNPLIEVMMDADNDGDTLGENGFSNLNLTDEEKEEFYKRSSVEEQLNQYGKVFLGTGGHFEAAVKANGLDDSNITFADGKSNAELAAIVNDTMRKIVNSPFSYGAYAVSFTNDETIKRDIGRLAEDGIKGDKEELSRIFDEGYTVDENRAILKALVAKSEWTGLAGAVTNNLIAGLSGDKFDAPMTRVAMDLTHSMTQSVLQMKKNADKLASIDAGIKDMTTVMSGKYSVEESREILKTVTEGLVPPAVVDEFVDRVAAKQTGKRFGHGVINNTETTTMKLAYATGDKLGRALKNISEDSNIIL